ncbi:smoothened homolog [Schistocerca gregaria]|uniref:smoothened homolog n=1 Tax=Schistocerca gregaria TaxID=7010 RepID=UPI00211E294E|nr:smoothened homolog [Schistocerca gregaria]
MEPRKTVIMEILRYVSLSIIFVFTTFICENEGKKFYSGANTSELLSTTHRSGNFSPAIFKGKEETVGKTFVSLGSMSSNMIDLFPPVESLMSHANGKSQYCRRPAKCQKLNYTSCMGMKLPYEWTTLELVPDVDSQDSVQERLQVWQKLRRLPKCWSVIQPFLCALYMPKCENEMVDLPSQEMCKVTVSPCRILDVEGIWPSFLKCDNMTKFPPMCKNDVRELKFNVTGHCQEPLVPTENSKAFYDGTDGCGIQCEDPLFTTDEQQQIHNLIGWAGSCCLFLNVFTVVTFLIDWRSANKYPALIIFYINCCFLVSCTGWLAQFTPGARKDIVCRKDGTLRMSEPSAGENLSCVIIFVVVYYFLMAAVVWFVILTYAWHLSFQALGKVKEKIDKKGSYFHLVAWSLPLILTITTMALGEIDGNSVAGICFVGYLNHTARYGLLLAPLSVAVVVGGYFLSRGLVTLIRLKIGSHDIISPTASAKIRETIVRMGLFSLFLLVLVLVTFTCHVYEYRNQAKWNYSFRKYIVCKIIGGGSVNNGNKDKCRMESRPSLAIMQLHVLTVFAAGIVMSSWIWTGSTIHTWKRFLRRVLNNGYEEPVRLKKHKVIAQAFAKRKALNNDGRLSLSFHSTHEDPVGLNFDVNSMASQDLSSTWAAALPKLMTRRGALIGATTGSMSSQRRNSFDSEISYSVRKVSVESRRHSLDSQVSVQIAEVTATRKTRATPLPTVNVTRGRTHRSKRRRRDFTRCRVGTRMGPLVVRKGSSSSQESQLGAQILTALTIGNSDISSMVPNLMKRREASAGLDGLKLMLPLPSALLGQSSCGSEEDLSDCKKCDEIECEVLDGVRSDKNEAVKDTIVDTTDETENKKDYKFKENEDEVQDRKACSCGSGVVNKDNELSTNKDTSVIAVANQSSFCDLPTTMRTKGAVTSSSYNKNQLYMNTNIPDDIKLSEISDDDANFLGASYDDTTSYCPELQRLAGSLSDASVFTHHTLGGSRVRTVGVGPCTVGGNTRIHVRSREVGTQTTPSEDIGMCELNSRGSTYSSGSGVNQGTQVSFGPQHENSVKPYKGSEKLESLTGLAAKGLNYSYNMSKLVEELAEIAAGHPLQLDHRKTC